MSSPKLYHKQIGITIIEVKYLMQTIVIEIGYREINAWLE
jgi:hypothetical protein